MTDCWSDHEGFTLYALRFTFDARLRCCTFHFYAFTLSAFVLLRCALLRFTLFALRFYARFNAVALCFYALHFTLSRFYVLRFTLCAFRFTLYALRLTLYAYNYSDTRCLTLVVLYSLSLSSLFYTGPLTLTLYYSLSYTRSFMLALFTLFLTAFPLPTYVTYICRFLLDNL